MEEPLSTGCWFDDRGGPTFIETVGSAFADGPSRENEDNNVDNDSDGFGIFDVGVGPLPSRTEVVLAMEYCLSKRA